MAYITPPDVKSPYSGDQQFWQGYELFQTNIDDGLPLHQTLVQDRLNEFQAYPDLHFQILAIETRVFEDTLNPNKGDFYLTTVNFSVIGPPGSYPL